MANLVSPGVSVTVTDESFFIPASAATVPLIFLATADEKKRADGVTDAAGTFEHNVIRTVTSLKQSTELYGIPRFLEDAAGNPLHGDVRNEYGLFALNQYLGVGDLAYVVRANVNLNDNLSDIRVAWDTKMQESAYVLENLVNAYLNEYNVSNGFVVMGNGGQTAVDTLGAMNPGVGYAIGTFSNVTLAGGTGSGATANITVTQSAVSGLGTITPGFGYTVGTHPAVPLTGGTGTGATANITVTASAIDTFDANLVGGFGYAAGTYTNVTLTGGTGTGATANITVSQSAINAATITAVGSYLSDGTYTDVALVTVTGTGSGATADVVVAGGLVTTVTFVEHGVGYAVNDTVRLPDNFAGATGDGGFVATITSLTGTVTAVTISNHGVGYIVGDTLTASSTVLGVGGSGFAVTVATLSGAVTAVTLVSAGSGYLLNQGLSATSLGGTGFSIPITALTGAVASVTVVSRGIGYTVGDILSAPTLTLGSGFSIEVATLTGYKSTVDEATMLSLASAATQQIWNTFSFKNSEDSFTLDASTYPKPIYPNGYNSAAVGTYIGLMGITSDWVIVGSGSVVPTEWTAEEAGQTLLTAADSFKYTTDFLTQTSLGANDAARRVAVVTALQEAINSNTDIRSETYEYNLILCPGFPEVVDEMLNLCIDVQEEAMVIADTPFDKDPDEVVIWGATSARRSSRNIAYYYPHGIASNLDGKDVFVAASGTALRTITYSDDVSELWFAPAGTRRGLVSGLSMVGHVSGTLGTATTFVETALNIGQRNNLYKYFTNINPIVFFPGRGIVVYGQKTSAPDASALDRINVVRLVAYIKRQLRKNTMSFVFEPNDQLTRDNIKATVDAFLSDLIVKRGLYDFATVCDESNNTPDRIDRNELYVDIALKPVRAAEFIYIPIRVVATGAQI